MRAFRVTIEADFIVEASTAEVVRKKVNRLLKDNGFQEKNFDYGIEPIKDKHLIGKDV